MAGAEPKRLTDQQIREIAALLRPHLETLRAVRAVRLAREKAAAA
jgi:hypothetical protein